MDLPVEIQSKSASAVHAGIGSSRRAAMNKSASSVQQEPANRRLDVKHCDSATKNAMMTIDFMMF
jgi:hypothetical protein